MVPFASSNLGDTSCRLMALLGNTDTLLVSTNSLRGVKIWNTQAIRQIGKQAVSKQLQQTPKLTGVASCKMRLHIQHFWHRPENWVLALTGSTGVWCAATSSTHRVSVSKQCPCLPTLQQLTLSQHRALEPAGCITTHGCLKSACWHRPVHFKTGSAALLNVALATSKQSLR